MTGGAPRVACPAVSIRVRAWSSSKRQASSQRRVILGVLARHLANGLRFCEGGCGGGKVTCRDHDVRPGTESARKRLKRADIASELNGTASNRLPALEVPVRPRDALGVQQQREIGLLELRLVAERDHPLAKEVCTRWISLLQQLPPSSEQQLPGTRSRSRICSASASDTACRTSTVCRDQNASAMRLKVRRVRERRIPLLEPVGGGQKLQERLGLLLAGGAHLEDFGFEALDARQLELVEMPRVDRSAAAPRRNRSRRPRTSPPLRRGRARRACPRRASAWRRARERLLPRRGRRAPWRGQLFARARSRTSSSGAGVA